MWEGTVKDKDNDDDCMIESKNISRKLTHQFIS